MTLPTPDLKPHVPPQPPGSEGCGCCDGVEVQTPQPLFNRYGLPALGYRIGEHAQFRASLHARLSSSAFAPLAALRTRDDTDFTIGLVDAFACAADVLTFYQERIANESYLRTATERVSLQEMGKLIGYRLRPGVAAETWLAFAMDTPPLPPPTLAPEPGNFVTGVPDKLLLPAGLKVQSVPGPDEKPQTFETGEGLEARPAWNAMRALADEDRAPVFGARETWLAGTATQLKPGDLLLFVGPQFAADSQSNRWDARVLTQVQPDDAHQRTRVAWAEPLGSVTPFMQTADPPAIYALRDRAAIFGHNAVAWQAMSDDFKRAYLGLPEDAVLTAEQRAEWPQFDIFAPGGSGSRAVKAFVTAAQAAQVLRETAQASLLSQARESATATAALGGAATALVQRIATLPAHLGQASLQVAGRLPEAIGQVAQDVMAPLRSLVGGVAGSVEVQTRRVDGLVNAARDAGIPLPASSSGSAPPPPPAAPPPAANLFTSGLSELHGTLSTALQQATGFGSPLENEIGAVGADARHLWSAQGHLVESAIAGSAATAVLARFEADLLLQPKLPFADVAAVCDAVDAAGEQMLQWAPDFVVATALSDPRVGAALLALLAEDPGASLSSGVQNTTALPAQLKQALAQHDDPAAAGRAAAQLLAVHVQAQGDAALQPLAASVQRLHSAASAGVRRLVQTVSAQSARLRQGLDVRFLAGHRSDTISLDRDYTGVLPGSYALLSKPDYVELYRVGAVAQTARAEFAISAKSSYVTLAGQNLSLFGPAVRETTVHARSEALARARAPITRAVSGAQVQVAAAVVGLAPGRRLLIKGRRVDGGGTAVHRATLLSATPAAQAADGGMLAFDPPLPWALQRDSTVVYGNVLPASHGETVAQILGAGQAAQPFQRFELKQLPLTWRAAATELGARAELTVRVGDIAWTERPTMFGAAPTERAYTLNVDEQGRLQVVFGDGVRGARLPSGVNNVRATYRKGLGSAGNVRAETLTQLMTRPLGLKSVANLLPAEGGTDPESAAAARQSMPLVTRTLGRAVSLLDYEDFARAFSGIAKAQAQVLNLRGGRTVAITIAAPDGGPLGPNSPVWTNLLAALKSSGDPHVPVQLLSAQLSPFHLGLRVKRDAAFHAKQVLAAVEAALRAAFSFDARALGQPVQHSEIVAVAQAIPGVVAVDLTHLHGGTQPAAQTVHNGVPNDRLLAARLRVVAGAPMAAELLTLNAGPLALLEEMP